MRNDKIIPGLGCYFLYAGKHGGNKITVKFMNNYADGIGLLIPKIARKMV